METLPWHIPFLSIATTLLTVALFYNATRKSTTTLIVIATWLILQYLVSRTGFYTHLKVLPPRFMLALLPPLLLIAAIFLTKNGRNYVDRLSLSKLTLLHVVRVPVEIGLYWLYIHKTIPQSMTFEGTNLDILSGLSAPFIYYFGFVSKKMGRKTLLAWNMICLVFLINIVVTAILSAPFPFQQSAFNQPNIAVFYFPYIWLPCCVVPLVLFAHLATIRQLVKRKGHPGLMPGYQDQNNSLVV